MHVENNKGKLKLPAALMAISALLILVNISARVVTILLVLANLVYCMLLAFGLYRKEAKLFSLGAVIGVFRYAAVPIINLSGGLYFITANFVCILKILVCVFLIKAIRNNSDSKKSSKGFILAFFIDLAALLIDILGSGIDVSSLAASLAFQVALFLIIRANGFAENEQATEFRATSVAVFSSAAPVFVVVGIILFFVGTQVDAGLELNFVHEIWRDVFGMWHGSDYYYVSDKVSGLSWVGLIITVLGLVGRKIYPKQK